MSSTSGNNFGHGASPFTGPNQVLVSGVLGQRTTLDLNSVPVGHVIARTADGIGAIPPSGGGAAALDDLTDVVITAPAQFELLQYDGAQWENAAVLLANLADVRADSPVNVGQVLMFDGAEWANNDMTFQDGTVSAPSIAFTDDLDTGFYRPTVDTIAATVGGVPAMELSIVKSVFGESATAGPDGVAIGPSATTGQGGFSAGLSASSVDFSIALGHITNAANVGAVVVGPTSTASGVSSIIIGSSAGALGLGAGVVGIGRDVLDGLMTNSPTGIVAIGDGAMSGALSVAATNSVAVGSLALAAMNGTAQKNVAVGQSAGVNVTNATRNTLVGDFAGATISSGSQNTIVGSDAKGSSTATGNTVIGHTAGSTTMGNQNTAVGNGALDAASVAVAECTAVGANALGGTVANTAPTATAVGFNALLVMGDATGNTAVGHSAGSTISTGSNNTFVGASSAGGATISNQTVIGAQAVSSSTDGVCVGSGTSIDVSSNLSTAVGTAAAVAANSVGGCAFGRGARVAGANSIAIGNSTGRLNLGASNVFAGAGAGSGGSVAVAETVAIGTLAFSGNYTGVAATLSTAVGHNTLGAVTTGTGNTVVGHSAGATISSGANNTIVGASAKASATVAGNTIVGQNAGSTAMGANNTAVGLGAFDAASVAAVECTAVGANALGGTVASTAPTATAVGFNALLVMGNATGNTAVGHSAGSTISTGANNTIVGAGAKGASTAAGNTIVGQSAGSTAMGANNTAVGLAAFDAASVAAVECTAVGANALGSVVSSTAPTATAVGFNALAGMTGGTGNTAVGHNAGNTGTALTTGSNNTIVGSGAGVDNVARAGTVVLGQGSSGTVDNGVFIRGATANVGAGQAMQFLAGGQIGPLTSSIRFKENVALSAVQADVTGKTKPFDLIRVVDYDVKTDGSGQRQLGIIAEELQPLVHPSLVPKDEEGNPISVAYDRLTCLLIQEVQLLRRRVAALEGAPMPNLETYAPVRTEDIYDRTQYDDDLMARQKQQSRDAALSYKIAKIAERIEKRPERESAILKDLNKRTRDAVLQKLEDKAVAEAARLEAEEELEKE